MHWDPVICWISLCLIRYRPIPNYGWVIVSGLGIVLKLERNTYTEIRSLYLPRSKETEVHITIWIRKSINRTGDVMSFVLFINQTLQSSFYLSQYDLVRIMNIKMFSSSFCDLPRTLAVRVVVVRVNCDKTVIVGNINLFSFFDLSSLTFTLQLLVVSINYTNVSTFCDFLCEVLLIFVVLLSHFLFSWILVVGYRRRKDIWLLLVKPLFYPFL